jgi:hypothetical protein
MGHTRENRTKRPQRPFSRPRAQGGFTIVSVTFIAAIVLIAILALFQLATQDAILVAHAHDRSQALYLAESGAARAMVWLCAQGTPPAQLAPFHPFGAEEQGLAGGKYFVTIVPDTTNGTTWRHNFTIVSRGTEGDHSRCVEVDIQTQLLSDFLYFTDTEHMPGGGNPLWFVTPDVVDGPLFTNDQISIFGDPTFLSRVTSAYGGPGDNNDNHEPLFLYYNGSSTNHLESELESNAPHDEPTFVDSYTLGAPQLTLPSTGDISLLKDEARAGGVSVSGDYDFYFGRPDENGDPMLGYVSYSKPGLGWVDVDLSSINGLIYVNGNLSVHGVVDGQVTIATNGIIEITDDVVYAGSDEYGPLEGCDDLLGLIACNDIVIGDTAPNQDDCEIHGALMTLANSFTAQNWNSGVPRGDLTVHGSLVQSFRGPVGSGLIQGDEVIITSGYAKDYHYDWRLQEMYPPGFYRFSQTGGYTRLGWREVPLEDGQQT